MNPVAATSVSTESMALVAFTGVASVILLLCIVTGPERDDLAEFYTGFGRLGPMRNGLAIAGDYISAATVLGTCGVVALTGYDGAVLALATALSLTLLMFLLAEPLRNAGQFTMGDVLARRMPGRAARLAACLVTPRGAAADDARPARGRGRPAGGSCSASTAPGSRPASSSPSAA